MNNDFKIQAKYLIDFENLKVGDRVWSINIGYFQITEIDKSQSYPIEVGDIWYTKDGKRFAWDKYPSLFRVNPFEDIREEFFADRLMEVRDNNQETWYKRVVLGKKNNMFLAWGSVNTLQDAKETITVIPWNQAREITPPSEELVHLTMQDISEGKGNGVPPHLIRIKE